MGGGTGRARQAKRGEKRKRPKSTKGRSKRTGGVKKTGRRGRRRTSGGPGEPVKSLAAGILTGELMGDLKNGEEKVIASVRVDGSCVSVILRRSAAGERLTKREYDVLWLMAKGLRNREIAKQLHITERTVKNHVTQIIAKLGVRSRTEAVSQALRDKLIKLD